VDEHILVEYLLGTLGPAERVAADAALAGSPALCAQLRLLADQLAEVGAALPPVAPTPSRRSALLAAVAPRPRLAGLVDAFARFVDVTREAAARLLGTVDAPDRWNPSPWPGIGIFHIEPGPSLAGAEVGIVRMRPGAHFPLHSHDGPERNLVLQGALVTSDGELLEAGAVYDGGPEVTHAFTALPGPDLIVVAVLECNLLFADGTRHGDH